MKLEGPLQGARAGGYMLPRKACERKRMGAEIQYKKPAHGRRRACQILGQVL